MPCPYGCCGSGGSFEYHRLNAATLVASSVLIASLYAPNGRVVQLSMAESRCLGCLVARAGEVVMMNSLTVNLHLMMVSFYRPTIERTAILVEAGSFPSDRYDARHFTQGIGVHVEDVQRPIEHSYEDGPAHQGQWEGSLGVANFLGDFVHAVETRFGGLRLANRFGGLLMEHTASYFETEEFAPESMPYIVVIIDELADLMMLAPEETEIPSNRGFQPV